MLNNTVGNQCVAVGAYALDSNTTANYNTAIGSEPLQQPLQDGTMLLLVEILYMQTQGVTTLP